MANVTPIRRLLIANRGEIARRIIRTAHAMGIGTVAVYSENDATAPFVQDADTAIAIGGRTAAESYLDIGKLIDACKRSGADAVHPGYGFLSESAGFAEAVTAAGLIWVGPSPKAIRAIGDKLAAKHLLKPLGVPLLEAFELPENADASTAAKKIGYPVLIKAAAGGGGRGMRIVEKASDLAQAIESARREAAASFGDGTVFLERWLSNARHVEIQILGDKHGNLVHLFERECSIQRRHQKIVEEAPSPAVDAALREQMGNAALAAGRAIGYDSTGTVEFLVSGREFFFLEVNTRLQVEHPVTEAVTGLDLVREQLRVAEGEALGFSQQDLRIQGHAIEVRLCAEDPEKNFLPTPGTVQVWEPPTGDGIRTDSGIESGSEIGIAFDPMMAKIIAWAPTRREAAAKLARALEATRVQGIVHNRDFLVSCLRSTEFLRGETDTGFIARVKPSPTRAVGENELHAAAIAAALHDRGCRQRNMRILKTIPGGFRNSVMPPEQVSYTLRDTRLNLTYWPARDGSLAVTVNGDAYRVVEFDVNERGIDLAIDGRRCRHSVLAVDDKRFVHGAAGDIELVELPRFPASERAEQRGGLKAPMPGKVMSVMVAEGDLVERGQPLLVLEAMKMEHRIDAPWNGTVKTLNVAAGDQVANGATLVIMEQAG
ncbi:MAG: biotin carboxylase N-terminal domain-containing protein [Bradyrhizobium sp.]|uniref:acetyl/propionyl/methylcrotonyl-CoA carboxylase subunit alpha n=1 Tax=Bradyrhizobium sp. TaxID=376 RepID=UPI002A27621D|nr:ATP-grasp domain-containing protein [Bradyrhizobium sp.]